MVTQSPTCEDHTSSLACGVDHAAIMVLCNGRKDRVVINKARCKLIDGGCVWHLLPGTTSCLEYIAGVDSVFREEVGRGLGTC